MAMLDEEWNAKENFTLACCVARNGDQNWVSVSRNMKAVTEACGDGRKRSPDFFAQKNCAHRYNDLLGAALTSKRKSRSSTDSTNIETPAEQVYRKLTFANMEELNDTIRRERERFMKLKNDLLRIQNGEMDDKMFDMWNSIQSGEAVPLENLVPDENMSEEEKESSEPDGSKSSRSDTPSPTNSVTPSRPHRQTKETEKFKSYIEQRQKHNAKYHHHQPTTTSTTIASPVTPMTTVKMAQSPVPTSQTSSVSSTIPLSTTPSSTSVMSGLAPPATAHGPTPVQVQNMITKVDTAATSKHTHSQGLLSVKTERPPPLVSPSGAVRHHSDSKEPTTPSSSTSSSFLSSLLSTPATDIKAQVSKITEVLKEPSEKRSDVHRVTDEAYKAYRKAQPTKLPISPGKNSAPALAKLLEVPSSPANNSPQISPVATASKPFPTPTKQPITKQNSITSALTSSKKSDNKSPPVETATTVKKNIKQEEVDEKPDLAREESKKPSTKETKTKDAKDLVVKDTKPASKETKPLPIDTKSPPKDTKPAPKDTKPDPKETKPAPKETKPAPKETKPALKETKPTLKETKPALKETKPALKETKPALKETKPALKETKPALKETKPALKETKSAPKDTKPVPKDSQTSQQEKAPGPESIPKASAAKEEPKVDKKIGEAIRDNKVTAAVKDEKAEAVVSPPGTPSKKEEKAKKAEEKTKQAEKTEMAPLSVDVGDGKVENKEAETSVNEPPPKKRVIDVAEITEAVAEVVTPSLRQKGKKKGRSSRGGRKKTFSGSLKIDVSLEEPDKSDMELDTTGDLDNEDPFERKNRPPLTPSMCSSPASPALSTGSNCDPEQVQQQRAWRKSIMLVWKAAASHKYANVFLHPVTDEEAPGYSSIIFRPMDLSLIKKNIETGVITTTTEFQRDIMLMFQNALMYNRKEHDVYRMAQEMRDDVMEQIQSFISTQLMLQSSGDRDAKNLRTKNETLGHTRQSSKSGLTFLSL